MIQKCLKLVLVVVLLAGTSIPASTAKEKENRYWVVISASTREERSRIANLGVAIEEVGEKTVGGSCDLTALEALQKNGLRLLKKDPLNILLETFPPQDADFHDYDETLQELKTLAEKNPRLVSFCSAGQSLQGRSLWAARFNSTEKGDEPSAKPGVIFLGTHHAREHLSNEVPLLLAQYLAAKYGKDPRITSLLDARDVYILPMVNPDGAEYDLEKSNYRMWRKNTRENEDGTLGVDLNRNYAYKWGSGGSSGSPGSDIYRGPAPFSEPETQAIKRFIESHANIRALLSFHTFSELILYPWGHTYDGIADSKDRAVFEKMAQTMAAWNGYKPQQSSDLYIASGDTTDWAYGVHKIFAFTFELTPKAMWQGGFYPGAKVIQSTFEANIKPCLYLIETAANPYAILETKQNAPRAAEKSLAPAAKSFRRLSEILEGRRLK